MSESIVELGDISGTQGALVGGKAANLGELSRIDRVRVPPGFCVTTSVDVLSAVADEIAARVVDGVAYAVRSSATAEDLPDASFAGQHDSFLDVRGADAVLAAVQRCRDSLFTARAVSYREHNGVDGARMAVIVQEMVAPRAAGVLFTADPLTSNRRVATVEAVAGLADALVSGQAHPDRYAVRDGQIISRDAPRVALSDAEVVQLVDLGHHIAAHFGTPQDIEWCLDDAGFAIVQSRPITTLFPLPDAEDDRPRVYLSTGHHQMMTDAMKPLAISLWRLIGMPRFHVAAGRLFVDCAPALTSRAGRNAFIAAQTAHDPLIGAALQRIADSGFVPAVADERPVPSSRPVDPEPLEADPTIVRDLVARYDAANRTLADELAGKTGAAAIDAILDDITEFKRLLFDPESRRVYTSAMDATAWLNAHLREWLGEKNVADTLTLSAPDNVSSEMGLALLDVADAIRPVPELVAALEHGEDPAAIPAVASFLHRYGARCSGEIDITRPRWREQPAALVPLILANVRNFEPGEGPRRSEQGRLAALAKRDEVLQRLRALPDGAAKATETRHMIDRVRTFIGYREYPEYFMVERFFVYKQAVLAEAARLAATGVLREPDDVFFLDFAELAGAARSGRVDHVEVAARRAAFAAAEPLVPPRVMTSEGEVFTGAHPRDDVPTGALVGVAVSSGTAEGRARVIRDIAEADIGPGDILVTSGTDPSWSPLLVAIAGLVTEVGGLMTHGAVVAREYGVPAVVGVPDATRLIPDGRRIRVHGADGYVEVLPED